MPRGQINWSNPGEYHGRLSLALQAVPLTDILAATTVYFIPFKGNTISLWDGERWVVYPFSTMSFTVPATTNTQHDVYMYLTPTASFMAFELIPWTSDTVRSVALALLEGAVVKAGDPTCKYLGTIRTTGVSGQTEDSEQNRLVRNHATFVKRILRSKIAYTGADAEQTINVTNTNWAPVNGGVGATLRYLANAEGPLDMTLGFTGTTDNTNNLYIGLGDDSTTTAVIAVKVDKKVTENGAVRLAVQKAPGSYTISALARVTGGTSTLTTNFAFAGGTAAASGLYLDGTINA